MICVQYRKYLRKLTDLETNKNEERYETLNLPETEVVKEEVIQSAR